MKRRKTKASASLFSALAAVGVLLSLGFTPATPVMKAYADPPPWAPAHGYRNKNKKWKKHRVKYEQNHEYDPEVPILSPVRVLKVRCNRDIIGGIVGGIIGGVIGSKVSDGDTVATAAGTVAGVLVGRHVGKHMDAADRRCTGQVLENVEDNQPVAWQNTESDADYTVTPYKTYKNDSGTYCRDYQTQVVIDGQIENKHGTACRTENGRWEIASS